MDAADEEVVVVYHSHTATEAYPSRTDISYAGEPQAHYVLVSTREPESHEFRSYRIVDGMVTEEPVEIIPAARDVAVPGADSRWPAADRSGSVATVSDNGRATRPTMSPPYRQSRGEVR